MRYTDSLSGQSFDSPRLLVQSYLSRFAERTNLGPLTLDEDDFVELRRGSAEIGVHVFDPKAVMMIYSPILSLQTLDTKKRLALYQKLLEMSFLSTGEASFAIQSSDEKVVVRSFRRIAGLDYTEFEGLLNNVGSVADRWDDELKKDFL